MIYNTILNATSPYFQPSASHLLPTCHQRNPMKLCEILRITPYELMNAGDNSRKKHEKE